ncbi:MAG: phosphatidate cytidylyltransferase [Ignavibacteriae bacterium HGW-Ignavibacteriae-4]|jgi:phosphatidate cytidylyltransferase|nr:MAG: phosphatidate cytidylyltransferase [Ignavibacteriae bacterium HGW-Ignavibacteriae-4]
MKELGKRILTAAIGIPLAIFLFLQGGIFFAVGILIIIGFGLHEFYSMAENKGYHPMKWASIVVSLIAGVIFFLTLTGVLEYKLIYTFLAPTLIGTFLITLALYKNGISAITDISISIGGIMYVAFPLLCLIAIREFNYLSSSEIDWGYFVLTLFIAIWLCDSAAYFIGRAIGKHKLFPRHSPKKSWEGAIAGFVFGAIGFVGLTAWLNPSFGLANSIIVGAIITTFCQLGDLIESHFKRDAEVKDSSNFFPGHGGFLDRFDGVIFISPIILFILVLIV